MPESSPYVVDNNASDSTGFFQNKTGIAIAVIVAIIALAIIFVLFYHNYGAMGFVSNPVRSDPQTEVTKAIDQLKEIQEKFLQMHA